MAKTIKAIKCPQCGSTQNTTLGEDKYHCNHCNADFFLDNGDINVFINKKVENPYTNATENSGCLKIIGICALIFVALTIGIIIMSNIFGEKTKNTITTPTINKEYSANFVSSSVASFNNKALYIEFVKYNYPKNTAKNTHAIFVYDALKKQKLKDVDIPNIAGTKANVKSIKNDIYIIAGTKNVYRLNNNYSVTEITDSLKNNYTELKSGIGSIVFATDCNAFIALANDGKNYYVFPEYNKIYPKDEIVKKQSIEVEGKTEKYNFALTENNKLVKIKYKTEDIDLFLIPKSIKETETNNPNILNIKEVSDKTYINPIIIYSDNEYVIVNSKNEAKTEYIIECINAINNKTEWSFTTNINNNTAYSYKDGFVMSGQNKKLTTINFDGTNKQTIEFK